MASVQELIESLLDEKMTRLLEGARAEAVARERQRWYQIATVAFIALLLFVVLTLVNTYRMDWQQQQQAIEACEKRNGKERVLLKIFEALEKSNSDPDTTGMTPEEVQRRAEALELFSEAKEQYMQKTDCAALFRS